MKILTKENLQKALQKYGSLVAVDKAKVFKQTYPTLWKAKKAFQIDFVSKVGRKRSY